jgi:hypothetical protein
MTDELERMQSNRKLKAGFIEVERLRLGNLNKNQTKMSQNRTAQIY